MRVLVAAILALALTAGLAAMAGGAGSPVASDRAAGHQRDGSCLATARIEAAERYAKRRAGRISFAVRDECGRLVGSHRFRVHHSASVVKVMMMVAYLNLGDVRDRELRRSERKLLGPLIKKSSDESANELYGMLGERRIEAVARRANMRRFSTQPTWGLSRITAGDQARFVLRLERYLSRRHEDYALGLMARVIDPQRWGMPRVKPKGWKIRLKGGWSGATSGEGWRVNQVARLENGDRRFSAAILTRFNPSFGYGRQTIKGVARRLFADVR